MIISLQITEHKYIGDILVFQNGLSTHAEKQVAFAAFLHNNTQKMNY